MATSTPRAFNGEIYRTLTPRTGLRFLALQSDSAAVPTAGRPHKFIALRHQTGRLRLAHNVVLPEPVAPTTNTFSPERSAMPDVAPVGALTHMLEPGTGSLREQVHAFAIYVRLWHRLQTSSTTAETPSFVGLTHSSGTLAWLTHSSCSAAASSGGRIGRRTCGARSRAWRPSAPGTPPDRTPEQVDRKHAAQDQPGTAAACTSIPHRRGAICMPGRWPAICPRRSQESGMDGRTDRSARSPNIGTISPAMVPILCGKRQGDIYRCAINQRLAKTNHGRIVQLHGQETAGETSDR